MSETYE